MFLFKITNLKLKWKKNTYFILVLVILNKSLIKKIENKEEIPSMINIILTSSVFEYYKV